MKNQFLFPLILGLFSISILMGCSTPDNASPVFSADPDQNSPRSFSTRMADSMIGARVKSKIISDDFVHARSIDVDVYNRIAYLKGTVETDSQKRMAADLTRGVEGVVRVENQLMVEKNTSQGNSDSL